MERQVRVNPFTSACYTKMTYKPNIMAYSTVLSRYAHTVVSIVTHNVTETSHWESCSLAS